MPLSAIPGCANPGSIPRFLDFAKISTNCLLPSLTASPKRTRCSSSVGCENCSTILRLAPAFIFDAGVYKPEFQNRAFVFEMKSGVGVHIPVNSPDWRKNGNNVSILLSISYQYKDTNRKFVYQANHYLRKLALHPAPPGQSFLLDGTKRTAVAAGLKGKNLLHFRMH